MKYSEIKNKQKIQVSTTGYGKVFTIASILLFISICGNIYLLDEIGYLTEVINKIKEF